MTTGSRADGQLAVTIIDVAAQAREMFGDNADLIAGRQLAEHDYRFEAVTATGGRVTFHSDATAEHVMTYLTEREREQRG